MDVNTSNQTPLLFLPGLLCDRRIWSAQVDRFGDRPTIVVDGYGMADSLGAMADHALADAPASFIVAGHSMGARVALEVVRRAPERVAALALLDTGVHLPRPNEAASRHELLALGRREGIDALLDRWLPPMVLESRRDDPALMAPLRAMCRAGGVDLYAAQINALLGRPDVAALLPALRCPVFVGVGRQDRWSPLAQHEAIARTIPQASLAIFEECGHMSPVEAPDQVNASLARWLASLPDTGHEPVR